MRATSIAIVLVAPLLVLPNLAAAAKSASHARRGAAYQGSGRLRHILVTPGGPNGEFLVRFRVAGDGHQLVRLHIWRLGWACDGHLMPPFSPVVGSARIRPDGSFGVGLRDG